MSPAACSGAPPGAGAPRRRGRWPLAASLLLCGAVCLTPISDPDLPWHLSVGRRIAESRAVPARDFLSWTMAGRPWADFEWGSELLFYGLHRAGGAAALWLFKAAVFAALLLLFASLLRLWGLPDSWTAAALPCLVVALLPSLDIRPEMFSFLLCLVQLYLLESRRTGKTPWGTRRLVLIHAPLYTLWANLHAGYPAGLGLCLLYLLGRAAQSRRPGKPLREWARELAPWAGFLLAGTAGTCLTPFGTAGYSVLLEHWRYRELWSRFIQEWSAPSLRNPYQAGYWLLLLFSYLCFILSCWRGPLPPVAHLLSLVTVSVLASRSYRLTLYVPLLLFPLALCAVWSVEPPAWWRRWRPWSMGVALSLVAACGWRVSRSEGLFLRISREERFDPRGARAFLEREAPALARLRMFNPWNWGGALGWGLPSAYRVFVDGRYLFAEFLPKIARAERDPASWRRFLDEQGVDLALLETYRDTLVRLAPASPEPAQAGPWRPFHVLSMPARDWALVYWDSQAMVFVRRSAVPRNWIEPREFRALHPNDLQFLSLVVLSRALPLDALEPELLRHIREVRDSEQSPRLVQWLRGMRRELELRRAGG